MCQRWRSWWMRVRAKEFQRFPWIILQYFTVFPDDQYVVECKQTFYDVTHEVSTIFPFQIPSSMAFSAFQPQPDSDSIFLWKSWLWILKPTNALVILSVGSSCKSFSAMMTCWWRAWKFWQSRKTTKDTWGMSSPGNITDLFRCGGCSGDLT